MKIFGVFIVDEEVVFAGLARVIVAGAIRLVVGRKRLATAGDILEETSAGYFNEAVIWLAAMLGMAFFSLRSASWMTSLLTIVCYRRGMQHMRDPFCGHLR